jgi:hypothetical protein
LNDLEILGLPPKQPVAPRWLWLLAALLLVGAIYDLARPTRVQVIHDGNTYVAGAIGLAEGRGYRFVAHLGEPRIGIYPPGHSAWLALFWKRAAGYPAAVARLGTVQLGVGLAAMALVFLVLCHGGLPSWLAALAAATWALGPWWVAGLYALLSDAGWMVWLYALLWLWQSGRLRSDLRGWALTGSLLAGAYLWRTATLAWLVLPPLWLLWRRPAGWRGSLLAYSLPVLAVVLLWRGGQAGTVTYGEAFRQMSGGQSTAAMGLRFLPTHLGQLASGEIAWDFVNCGVAKAWREACDDGGIGRLVGVGVLALVAGLAVLLTRGWNALPAPRREVTTLALGLYGLQLLSLPYAWPARLAAPVVPVLVGLLWSGWTQLAPTSRWRRVSGPGLLALLAGGLIANTYATLRLHRHGRHERPETLSAVAQALGESVPPDATIALAWELPVTDLHLLSGRRWVVDPFAPLSAGYNFLPPELQGHPRVQFRLTRRSEPQLPPPAGVRLETLRELPEGWLLQSVHQP